MAPRAHLGLGFDERMLHLPVTPETNGSALGPLIVEAPLGSPRRARRTGWTYCGHAAVHPSNLLLLIGVMFLSLILWNGPVLVAGLGVEGAFLCLAPRLRFFRSRIDEALDEVDRALAARAREMLIAQMAEVHRQELLRIESLVSKTFSNVERRGLCPPVLDERLGLTQLSTSYIRLAIAHRACEESLALTNRHLLDGTIRSLEAAEASSPDRARALVRRRLGIARRRVERWAHTRDDLEAIGHQLATISEIVQLVHQESLVPPDPSGIGATLDRFLAVFDENAGALREVAELGVAETYDLVEAAPPALKS
jgi:hypothetical protein